MPSVQMNWGKLESDKPVTGQSAGRKVGSRSKPSRARKNIRISVGKRRAIRKGA